MKNQNNFSPDALVDLNMCRAVELFALRMITTGTSDEIHAFADEMHKRLDICIDETLIAMEERMKINESLKNPKIAK